MKRPFGLVFSAFALGLLAASILFVIGLLLVSALTVHNDPSAALLGFAFIAVPLMAVLAWLLFTLAGLLRLRSSARTSITVLAVLLLFAAFGTFAVATATYLLTRHRDPGLPPQMLAIYLGELLPGVIFLGLGVWWLIYFNQSAIAALFQPTWLRTAPAAAGPYSRPSPYPYQPVPPPSGYAQGLQAQSGFVPQVLRPYPMRPPGRFDRVPGSIQLIAGLLLFGAACGLVAALLPFPVFFLGSVIPGIAGHLVWALLALVGGLTGWGLLRLDNRARLMAYAYLVFGCINVPISLTHRSLNNLNRYVGILLSRWHLPNQPAIDLHYTAAMLLPSSIFSLAIYAAAFFYLHRHRHAFARPGASPPMI